jgi:wyosine [tRNA(Phe)-imidazoG37] synthetase (radical SAM superfamily)
MRLTTRVHDRDAAGMTYVYPVVSRRARGVSVGVNLNPNNACNWRCVYCQVPGLVRGVGPAIDLERLEGELDAMLGALVDGDYMERHVPEGSRRLNDVALSGNGEPTSSPDFDAALDVVGRVLARRGLAGALKVVLITNGSLVHAEKVQRGLAHLRELGGEVWYKLDRATDAGQAEVNDAHTGAARALANLRACADLCPTWIQTCVFARRGAPPADGELEAYLTALRDLRADPPAHLEGVLLYGLARPSHQPEAPELSPLPAGWLEAFAHRIEQTGWPARVSV